MCWVADFLLFLLLLVLSLLLVVVVVVVFAVGGDARDVVLDLVQRPLVVLWGMMRILCLIIDRILRTLGSLLGLLGLLGLLDILLLCFVAVDGFSHQPNAGGYDHVHFLQDDDHFRGACSFVLFLG